LRNIRVGRSQLGSCRMLNRSRCDFAKAWFLVLSQWGGPPAKGELGLLSSFVVAFPPSRPSPPLLHPLRTLAPFPVSSPCHGLPLLLVFLFHFPVVLNRGRDSCSRHPFARSTFQGDMPPAAHAENSVRGATKRRGADAGGRITLGPIRIV